MGNWERRAPLAMAGDLISVAQLVLGIWSVAYSLAPGIDDNSCGGVRPSRRRARAWVRLARHWVRVCSHMWTNVPKPYIYNHLSHELSRHMLRRIILLVYTWRLFLDREYRSVRSCAPRFEQMFLSRSPQIVYTLVCMVYGRDFLFICACWLVE